MPRSGGGGGRSSGGGRSGGSSSGGGTVHVSGYTRSNGTVVSGYTRSAASSSPSSRSSTSSSSPAVHVSSYTRSNGTVVAAHTRAAPSASTSNSRSSAVVHVPSYTRSDGTPVAAHTRAAPGSASSSPAPQIKVSGYTRRDGTVVAPHTRTLPAASTSTASATLPTTHGKTYVDNAMNRRLGRVGEPLYSRPGVSSRVRKSLATVEGHLRTPGLLELLLQERHSERADWHDLVHSEETQAACEACPAFRQHLDALETIASQSACNEKYLADRLAAAVSLQELQRDASATGFRIPWSDIEYERADRIGSGAYADVYYAKLRGTPVALKVLKRSAVTRSVVQSIEQEMKIVRELRHDNIVHCLGLCIDDDLSAAKSHGIAFVLEYVEGNSVHSQLHVRPRDFSLSQRLQILRDAWAGLAYLHARGVAHRDCKPENMLMSSTDSCKLGDFGFAKLKHNAASSSSVNSPAGTYRYAPPEINRGERLADEALFAADVYSLAVASAEVLTNEEPFDDYDLQQLREHVGFREPHAVPRLDSDTVPEALVRLLHRCWARDPALRPKVSEVSEALKGVSE